MYNLFSVIYYVVFLCQFYLCFVFDIPKAVFSLLLQITYAKDSVLNKALE